MRIYDIKDLQENRSAISFNKVTDNKEELFKLAKLAWPYDMTIPSGENPYYTAISNRSWGGATEIDTPSQPSSLYLQKYTIEYIKTQGKIAIHCPTKGLFDAVCKLSKRDLSTPYINMYGVCTVFYVDGLYGSIQHAEQKDYPIISAERFLADNNTELVKKVKVINPNCIFHNQIVEIIAERSFHYDIKGTSGHVVEILKTSCYSLNELDNYCEKEEILFTLEDLKQGRVICINNGSKSELTEVLRMPSIVASKTYYWYEKGSLYFSDHLPPNLPEQSVKLFLNQIKQQPMENKTIQLDKAFVMEMYREATSTQLPTVLGAIDMVNQTVTYDSLKCIYNIACDTWKTKLEKKFPEVFKKDTLAIPAGIFTTIYDTGQKPTVNNYIHILGNNNGKNAMRGFKLIGEFDWNVEKQSDGSINVIPHFKGTLKD